MLNRCNSYQNVSNFMRLTCVIGVVFGLLFFVSAFVPIGPYHSLAGEDIVGGLWNFMLPTGWFGLVAGIVLVFHGRIGLKNRRLAIVLFAFSLLLMALFLLQDVDYFLSLWHGGRAVEFDVDHQGLGSVSFFLGIAGVFTSLLLMALVRGDWRAR
jgi:hypothetical protein